jgi:hypothetical protein
MTKIYHDNENFQKVIFDWGILQPDLGVQRVVSILGCAILCSQKCLTVSVLPDLSLFICQMNKRKGTCMEKEEAVRYPASRMYQKKVRIFVGIGILSTQVTGKFIF